MTEKSFAQQVEEAAQAAGITEDAAPPTTPKEESPTVDEHTLVPAEVLAEEPKEEAKAEPAPEQAGPKEELKAEPQTVPLAVHIRQREKFDREMQGLREVIAVGNQRLAELQKALAPLEKPPADRTTDPLGAALEGMDDLKKQLGETKESLAKRDQEEANRKAIEHFQKTVISDEQSFTEQAPDYPAAVEFAKSMKFREYTALGLDAQEAVARVQQDAFALAQHALQKGYSPAQMVYQMAEALGYKKQSAASQQDGSPVKKNPAEAAVEMRAAGSQRGKTTGGASATTGNISFADLAAMDNEEFAKLTSGKKWERLFGGT